MAEEGLEETVLLLAGPDWEIETHAFVAKVVHLEGDEARLGELAARAEDGEEGR